MISSSIRRTGNLFRIIILTLILLIAIVLAYTTFFMDRYAYRRQVHATDEATLSALRMIGSGTEKNFENLIDASRSLLASSPVIQCLFCNVPSGSAVIMDVLQELKKACDRSDFINALWLYTPVSGMIYASDGYYRSISESDISELISGFDPVTAQRIAPDLRFSVFRHNGHLYTAIAFVPSNTTAVFFFRLDSNLLLEEYLHSASPFFVVNESNVILYENGTFLSEEKSFDNPDEKAVYHDLSTERPSASRYYLFRTRIPSWSFYQAISIPPRLPSRLIVLEILLPAFLLSLIIGIIASLFISNKIYEPINRLMKLVMDAPNAKKIRHADVDFLEVSFQNALRKSEQTTLKMENLNEDLYRFILNEAHHGRLHPETDINEIAKFIPCGRYQAFCFHLLPPVETFSPALNARLRIEIFLRHFSLVPGCLSVFNVEKDNIIAVMLTDISSCEGQQDTLSNRIYSSVTEVGNQISCKIAVGIGSCVDSLFELKGSYEEVVKDLSYNLYRFRESGSFSHHSNTDHALEIAANRLIESASVSDTFPESAVIAYAELSATNPMGMPVNEVYDHAFDLLLEKLHFPQSVMSVFPASGTRFLSDDCRQAFIGYCLKALDLYRTIKSDTKSKYIRSGIDYMEKYYANSSLSVTDISEHAGISVSYFSSLFNEIMGESVVSYLNTLRVEQAKSLLLLTSITINEIGFKCGFNSPQTFGRVFTKSTSITPGEYRSRQLSAVSSAAKAGNQ